MTRAVFLDRDGIINKAVVREGKPYPPASVNELELTEGIEETLAALKRKGFRLVVVTNQPDVARKKVPRPVVEQMHQFLQTKLGLDGVYACYHDDADACTCRKPKPGLLLNAAADMQIDLKKSYMVGDRWRDVDAGSAAGCLTIFVDYHYDESLRQTPDFVVESPAAILTYIT